MGFLLVFLVHSDTTLNLFCVRIFPTISCHIKAFYILFHIVYNCIPYTYALPVSYIKPHYSVQNRIPDPMGKITTAALVLCLLPFVLDAQAQEIIDLYNSTIPNSKVKATRETESPLSRGMYRRSAFPTLEVFRADQEKSTDAAVIICPGGGYSVIVYEGEGVLTAKELAKNGVTAFVLKYRLLSDYTLDDKAIGPVEDGEQDVKMVCEREEEWNLGAKKTGIMGCAAGCHLAATGATHFKKAQI